MDDTGELERILAEQYRRYPCMQVQDAVKLIYQNEFGGGHMISDREESLARLRDEYASVTGRDSELPWNGACMETLNSKAHAGTGDERGAAGTGIGTVCGDTGAGHGEAVTGCDAEGADVYGMSAGSKGAHAAVPLFEDIGNGLCRINLAGLGRYPVSLETVNNFFIHTANTHRGGIRSFESKLEILRDCCARGALPFSIDSVDGYIRSYRGNGYPPVSHSAIYRDAYHPAYRIVKNDFRRYFEVFCRIDELLGRVDSCRYSRNYVTVAIEGNCCAGKTSLAALLEQVYDCNVFHMDHFFLTPELRTEERLNETGGNVDYARFRDEVIQGIESGGEFEYRVYNCSMQAMERTVRVRPKKLNIVEGSYSMHPTLSEHYDLSVFLAVDPEEQSRRILERNGPVMHRRFMEEWVPKENRYFEEFRIASKCDIVIK